MIIESIHVRNFRSILNETLYCQDLTAIAGPNGAGKSAFLRALEVFYNPSAKVDEGDFYNSDTSEEIVVGITFVNLCEEAKKRFSGYLQGDKLTVERVIRYNDGRMSATYHGASLQHNGFQEVRLGLRIKDRGKTAKERYNALRADTTYDDLPPWTTISTVDEALRDWESRHETECNRGRDEGRFFGFDEVGQGYLGRFTRYLRIPAVRDAAEDALEGRGSVLTTLMDMVVRSALAQNKELQDLRDETQRKYNEIVDPERMGELAGLASVLSGTLNTYVPDAFVQLTWLPTEPVKIDLPKADIKLVEDQYATAVHRSGHGLQRAFIMTMLQHLTKAQATPVAEKTQESIAEGTASQKVPIIQENTGGTGIVQSTDATFESLPNLVLGIEEPELYQHPNRQRHLARILLQLARGITPGVAKSTQVIYTTHSPLFVGIDRFDQIRLLQKEANHDMPRQTRVVSTSLENVARLVWEADGAKGEQFRADTLAPRLHALMTTRVNEGFFAKAVVLVEGEDDYAAIVGAAKARSIELEAHGISVIPVGGKRNMDRPALIFREFGIPVYLVWDSDAGKVEAVGVCQQCKRPLEGKCDPEENRRLLRVVGDAPEDWPSKVTSRYCCFRDDLETTLKDEIGAALFEKLLAACQEEFGISKRKHAIKNCTVIAAIIERAKECGYESNTLNTVIGHIMALAEPVVERRTVGVG